MEIVSIEKKTFEMMLASFNALSEKVAALKMCIRDRYTASLSLFDSHGGRAVGRSHRKA